MISFRSIYLIPTLFLLGCGAAASLNTSDHTEDLSRDQFLNSGIWLSESSKIQVLAFKTPEPSLMIDLSQSQNASVQGAYLLSIPDEPTFLTSTLQAWGEFDPVTVRIIIQEGNDLTLLSEVQLTPENSQVSLQADLSNYRGREMTLIFNALGLNASAQVPALFWNSPRLVHP